MMKKAYCAMGYQCNNDCIICAVSARKRFMKEGEMSTDELKDFFSKLPEDTNVLELSGGEPTLRSDFFELLDFIKKRNPDLKLILLTNGRKLANTSFTEKLLDYNIREVIIAIHGNNKKIHERITRAAGSFNESILGIENGMNCGLPLTLKTIVTKLNYKSLPNIAEFLITRFENLERYTINGLDISGNALENFENVAVRYSQAKTFIQQAIDTCASYGVRVMLYGIPFCVLDEEYHKYPAPQPKTVFSYKSKSTEVINELFDDPYGTTKKCNGCKYKDSCFGVWYSYYEKFPDEIKPIIE